MIMEKFGLSPSPIIGKLKNALKDAILDGVIRNDYDEAMAYIIERAAEEGLKPVN